MNEIVRIIKTLVAYGKRRDLYPELIRKLKKNLFQRKNATKGKNIGMNWAKSKAISTSDFITQQLNLPHYQNFSEKFSEDFNTAKKREEECPIKMGGAGNLDLLYWIAESIEAEQVIETGVAYGWSSYAILESIRNREGKLYSSDMPYLAQKGDSYVGYVVPEAYNQNWELYRFADRESLKKIFEVQSEFDMAHYDSDKSYNGMMWGYHQIFPKIRKGGYFISDDINDNSAFKDFCEQNQLEPTVIAFEDKYIGILKK